MNKFGSLIAIAVLSCLYWACSKTTLEPGPTDPLSRIIKYDPDVRNITFNHCVTCHGGLAPSAGADLTNYQNVRFYTENGKLLQRINDASDPMPPGGLLSTEQRQIIAKWAADGFQNN